MQFIRPPMLVIVAGTAACLLASTARADLIVLDNGGRFSGVITYESEKVVSIKSEGTTWTFERSKIAQLEKEESGRKEEEQNDVDRRLARKSDSLRSRVVVYGTTWCGYCKKARNYFASRGIPFVDKDIEKDTGARAEVSRKCAAAGFHFNGSVPVLDVHGHILRGFSQDQVDRALRDG